MNSAQKETKLRTLLHVLRSTLDELSAVMDAPSVLRGVIGTDYQVTSSEDDGNVAENVRDDSFETRWSAKGSGQTLTIELPDISEVDSIQVAIHEGDKRKQNFELLYVNENQSELLIGNFETSGKTKGFESFTFQKVETKFLRLIGNGNSTSEWNSITGVRVNDPEAVKKKPELKPVQIPEPSGFKTNLSLDFEKHSDGKYTDAMWKSDFNGGSLGQPNTTTIGVIDGKKMLISNYAKGTFGRGGGLNQWYEFKGEKAEEAILSYDVLFEKGFDFGLGGKLLGFGFGPVKTVMVGGDMPTPTGGTTVRMMWVKGGKLKLYVYDHTKTAQWGSDLGAGLFGQIVPGQKHEIELRVKANTLGKNDGIIEVKFDGKVMVSMTDAILRIPTSPQYIESLSVGTFMGGDKKEFAPDHDQWMAMGYIEVNVKQ